MANLAHSTRVRHRDRLPSSRIVRHREHDERHTLGAHLPDEPLERIDVHIAFERVRRGRVFSLFDEKIDGFVYASYIALGFATYENLFYLPLLEGVELWGRALASPLIHTMFASIWGYTLALAVMENRSVTAALVSGVAVSAILHGLYDFMVFDPILRPVGALLVLSIWIWRIRTIERLHLLESRQPAAGRPE